MIILVIIGIVFGIIFVLKQFSNKQNTDINIANNNNNYSILDEYYTLLKIDEVADTNIYLSTTGEVVKMDQNGNLISNFEYGKAVIYADQYGFNGKSIIDYKGNIIVEENKYDKIKSLSGRYSVFKDEKCALMDLNGNVLTSFKYDDISKSPYRYHDKCYIIEQNDKYGVIDIAGNEIFECKYNMSDIEIYGTNNDDKFFIIKIENKCYCYNSTTYEKIFEFSTDGNLTTDYREYIYDKENNTIYIYQNDTFKYKNNIEDVEYFESNNNFYMMGNSDKYVILNKTLDIVESEVKSCVLGNDFLFVQKDNIINVYDDKIIKTIEGYTLALEKFKDDDKYKTEADYTMLLKDDIFYICDKKGNILEENNFQEAKNNEYLNTKYAEVGTYTYYSPRNNCDVLILPNKEIINLGNYGYFESICDYSNPTEELCNNLFVIQNKETDEQFLVDKELKVIERNTNSIDLSITYYKNEELLIWGTNGKNIAYNLRTGEKILETDKNIKYRPEFKILELYDGYTYGSASKFVIDDVTSSIYSLDGKCLYEIKK